MSEKLHENVHHISNMEIPEKKSWISFFKNKYAALFGGIALLSSCSSPESEPPKATTVTGTYENTREMIVQSKYANDTTINFDGTPFTLHHNHPDTISIKNLENLETVQSLIRDTLIDLKKEYTQSKWSFNPDDYRAPLQQEIARYLNEHQALFNGSAPIEVRVMYGEGKNAVPLTLILRGPLKDIKQDGDQYKRVIHQNDPNSTGINDLNYDEYEDFETRYHNTKNGLYLQKFTTDQFRKEFNVLVKGGNYQMSKKIENTGECTLVFEVVHSPNLGKAETEEKDYKELEKRVEDPSLMERYTKKEQAEFRKELERLQQTLGGMKEVVAVPDILFVTDINHDRIAITEAQKMGIPVVGFVDTNANPNLVDYPIPANDDAVNSLKYLLGLVNEIILDARNIATQVKAKQQNAETKQEISDDVIAEKEEGAKKKSEIKGKKPNTPTKSKKAE